MMPERTCPLPSGIFQGVGFLGQRHGHHGRGNVLGTRERHQFGPSCTKVKRRLMGSVETSLLLYTLKQDVGGVISSQSRMKNGIDECLNQSRVKNGIDVLMQNGTHALHGNPAMTCGLITKRTLPQLASIGIQQHHRGSLEWARGDPTGLNVLKCLFKMLVGEANGTDIEKV
ncbi:hypothetical protein TNCV_2257231 [Trichonephila clavipes]|nr:hypothetical protein TNCV_2257231 [Trichonephila clavipes]